MRLDGEPGGGALGRLGHRTCPSASASKRQQGFTIIEVLTVLVVAAILVGIAVPSIRNMVMSNSIAAANNQLVASLNYARGEAAADRQTVSICKTTTATQTNSNCDTSSNGYEEGWAVFMSYPDSSGTTVTKVLKYVTPDSMSGITIKASTNGQLDFNQFGFLKAAVYFVICDSRGWANGGQFARVITISQNGAVNSVAGNDKTQSTVTSCPSS